MARRTLDGIVRIVPSLACCVALLAISACTQSRPEGATQPTRTTTAERFAGRGSPSPSPSTSKLGSALGSPVPAAGAREPAISGAGGQQFVQRMFAGAFPFATVRQYLGWIDNKPGVASVSVSASLSADGSVDALVVVAALDGSQRSARCMISASDSNAAPLRWEQCPELAALWTYGGATSIASVKEARSFFPTSMFIPPTLPGGFTLQQISVPSSPAQAIADLFVVTATYGGKSGESITLKEQSAGVNGPLITDYFSCVNSQPQATPSAQVPIALGSLTAGTGGVVACAAWADRAMWYLLTSGTQPASTLLEAARAVEAVGPSP